MLLAEVVLELLARNLLDEAAQPVRAGAVEPSLARFELQRAHRVFLALARLEVAHGRAGEAVAEPRRMREQMPDGDRLGGRPQPVGAGGAVERFEDHELREFRQIFFHRVFDRKAVLLDELHGGGRGDGFGHRRDAEHRIELQRTAGVDIGDAECALIDDALAVGRHDDHACHVLALHRTAHRIVNGIRLLRMGGERPGRRAAEQKS